MQVNLPYALKTTLAYEGGYSNHPEDPGGATMKGVTVAVFHTYLKKKGQPTRDVRTITTPELQDIYKSGYWDKVNGDTLASGVDLVVFDYAVNSGPSRASKSLMGAVGGNSVDTIKKVCAERLSFLKKLATFKTFGKGWTARVNSVEAKGIVLAAPTPDVAKVILKDEAKVSTTKATTKLTGAASAAVTASSGAVAPVVAGSLSWVSYGLLGVAVIAAIALCVFLAKHSVQDFDRAKAMKDEADGL